MSRHSKEELHPFEAAQVEDHRKAAELRARDLALTEARNWFRDRHETPTIEDILSVAAKFEAYLTAPTTVLSDKEAGAQ